MRKDVVLDNAGGRVVIMDSITKVEAEDEGSIVIAASHGGSSSGEFALAVPLRLVAFNDAGIGKEEAGIASLKMLEAHGVACVTVSHDSARIGDSLDMWEQGVLSRLNPSADKLGLKTGDTLRAAITALTDRT